MISKELLSKVLDIDIIEHDKYLDSSEIIRIYFMQDGEKVYNYIETVKLADDVLNWSLDQEGIQSIDMSFYKEFTEVEVVGINKDNGKDGYLLFNHIVLSNEYAFEYAQWILDNRS